MATREVISIATAGIEPQEPVASTGKIDYRQKIEGEKVLAKTTGKKPQSDNLPAKTATGKSTGKKPISVKEFDDLPVLHAAEPIEEFDTIPKGWRLEPDGRGYKRWRWQMKDPITGKSITYINDTGKKIYKRGSKYVGKDN